MVSGCILTILFIYLFIYLYLLSLLVEEGQQSVSICSIEFTEFTSDRSIWGEGERERESELYCSNHECLFVDYTTDGKVPNEIQPQYWYFIN